MDDPFLLPSDGSPPKQMSVSPFATEDEFQLLLEQFPALLTASTFGENSPRRWMLLKRESGVPDSEGGASRWSLDHLFVDQDAIPTLVEVKRASNRELRRQVVGQILDYAANASQFWSADKLRTDFYATCAASHQEPNDQFAELLETPDFDEDEFWKRVAANLTSGRMRLLVVADDIPNELGRVIEFLNEQMAPATIAAVELRSFVNGADRILAPRIIGITSRSSAKKGKTTVEHPTNETEWWAEFEAAHGPELTIVGRETLAMLRRVGDFVELTDSGASYYVGVREGGKSRYPFGFQRNGQTYLGLSYLKPTKAFGDPASRRILLDRVNAIAGVQTTTDNENGFPNINLINLNSPESRQALEVVLEGAADALRNGTPYA